MTETEPNRPYLRGPQHYQALHKEITTRTQSLERNELFTIVFTATTKGEVQMDERDFLINLVFKPKDPKLKLNLEQSQLILSYVSDLLKEIEDEEKRIIQEEESKRT